MLENDALGLCSSSFHDQCVASEAAMGGDSQSDGDVRGGRCHCGVRSSPLGDTVDVEAILFSEEEDKAWDNYGYYSSPDIRLESSPVVTSEGTLVPSEVASVSLTEEVTSSLLAKEEHFCSTEATCRMAVGCSMSYASTTVPAAAQGVSWSARALGRQPTAGCESRETTGPSIVTPIQEATQFVNHRVESDCSGYCAHELDSGDGGAVSVVSKPIGCSPWSIQLAETIELEQVGTEVRLVEGVQSKCQPAEAEEAMLAEDWLALTDALLPPTNNEAGETD